MSAAELQELGLTPEQLAERRQKVSEMLKHNEPDMDVQNKVEHNWVNGAKVIMEGLPKPSRASRKDKGIPRKPRQEPAPEPQKAGAITQEHANTLQFLIDAEFHAREAFAEAEQLWRDAREKRVRFVDSLTKG